MLTGIHFILTYMCNFECEHCFLYCSPKTKGTFTINFIKSVLDDAIKIGTIEEIYFEGGEPFLFYPLMVEGIKLAKEMGFKVGIVTNGYWATSPEDTKLWLKPLKEIGIDDFSFSDDTYHYCTENEDFAKIGFKTGQELNLPVNVINIEKPKIIERTNQKDCRGAPIIGGDVMFRGRAVEKLMENLPKSDWETFTECPYEDLVDPKRIHLDPYGYVHICQGIIIGNINKTPLSEIMKNYSYKEHPIFQYIKNGGPALLKKHYKINNGSKFVDACHLCYSTRLHIIEDFPDHLGPKQIYGLENE